MRSIARKVSPPRIRRTIKDYFRLHRSRKDVPDRLSDEARDYIIRNREKGVPASKIAKDLDISARHVRRLWERYQKAGDTRLKMGRPKDYITEAQRRLVTDAYREQPVGVTRITMELKKNHDISYNRVYRILKKNGMAVASAAKSKRRKWIRYERVYANAMWYTDWHAMKDPRFHGYNLITYIDDASRCVTGAALFEHATSENAVMLLRLAIERFGKLASILSDNGSCFVGQNGRKKKGPLGTWQPTVFEEELLERGIVLINTRPYHPQTNGKLERFHRSLETEIWNYENLEAYIDYYNERRLHFSLGMGNYETPLMAFKNKKATAAIRKDDPGWMEKDAYD